MALSSSPYAMYEKPPAIPHAEGRDPVMPGFCHCAAPQASATYAMTASGVGSTISKGPVRLCWGWTLRSASLSCQKAAGAVSTWLSSAQKTEQNLQSPGRVFKQPPMQTRCRPGDTPADHLPLATL